jgi:hypothetical protein
MPFEHKQNVVALLDEEGLVNGHKSYDQHIPDENNKKRYVTFFISCTLSLPLCYCLRKFQANCRLILA